MSGMHIFFVRSRHLGDRILVGLGFLLIREFVAQTLQNLREASLSAASARINGLCARTLELLLLVRSGALLFCLGG